MYVDPALIEYSIRMVTATREPANFGLKELQPYILFGASPRASINLILTAKALAYVRGRNYALPQDVLDMAFDVLRHRIMLTYEAEAEEVTTDKVIADILNTLPVP